MISNPFALSSSGVFGCCWALRPRYKRLVDNIFPEDPEVGSKSSSHLLFFKSDAVLISPSSLSIGLSYRGLMKHCNNIVAKELLYKQKSENLYYCYWNSPRCLSDLWPAQKHTGCTSKHRPDFPCALFPSHHDSNIYTHPSTTMSGIYTVHARV